MQLSQISQKSLKRNGTNGTLRVGSVDKPGSMQSRKQRVAAGIGEKQKIQTKKRKEEEEEVTAHQPLTAYTFRPIM